MVLTHMNHWFNLDKYACIQARLAEINNQRNFRNDRRTKQQQHYNESLEHKNIPTWLKLIVIFSRPHVIRAALKFGLAALIMSRFERVGFALMMLCFAF